MKHAFILTFSLLSLSYCFAQEAVSTKEDERLEYIALSYQANLAAFKHGAFHFTFTRGTTKSKADAMAGRDSNSFVANGTYIFDGKDARYELMYPPEEYAKAATKVSKNTIRSSIFSCRMLTNGEVTLQDTPTLDFKKIEYTHVPQIHAGISRFYDKMFMFPLSLGKNEKRSYDLGQDLTHMEKRGFSLKKLQSVSGEDGTPLCQIVLVMDNLQRTYWVDEARGCLPVKIENVPLDPKSNDVTIQYSDLRRLGNAGWFPFSQVKSFMNGAIVERIELKDADCDKRPNRSDLRLDFPEAVRLLDNVRRTMYPARASWSFDDITAASRQPLPKEPAPTLVGAPEPEMPGEDEGDRDWSGPAIVVGGVLLLGVMMDWGRRRYQRCRKDGSKGEGSR